MLPLRIRGRGTMPRTLPWAVTLRPFGPADFGYLSLSFSSAVPLLRCSAPPLFSSMPLCRTGYHFPGRCPGFPGRCPGLSHYGPSGLRTSDIRPYRFPRALPWAIALRPFGPINIMRSYVISFHRAGLITYSSSWRFPIGLQFRAFARATSPTASITPLHSTSVMDGNSGRDIMRSQTEAADGKSSGLYP